MSAHATPQSPVRSSAERGPGALRMLVALAGTPAAWTIQTLVSYAISAYACYPLQQPLHAPLWDGTLMKIEWAVTIVCIGLGAAAASVAWRWWRQVRRADAQRGTPRGAEKGLGNGAQKRVQNGAQKGALESTPTGCAKGGRAAGRPHRGFRFRAHSLYGDGEHHGCLRIHGGAVLYRQRDAHDDALQPMAMTI